MAAAYRCTASRVQRTALRAGVSAVAGLSLVLSGVATAAHADPDPSYPSANQVADAKAAAQSAAGQVAALDQSLADSRDRVAALQDASATADEAANGAQLALDEATAASADLGAKAAAALAAADDASLTLSRYAAEVYTGGGDFSQLDVFFGAGGPQQVLDRAAGVDAVGAERTRLVKDAESARLVADNLRQQAVEAEARQAGAATAAKAAADAAQRATQDAQTQTAAIEQSQQQMVAQLAALQNTSVQLEQQRQAGIAAEQERQREEAARQAAEAAAKAAEEQRQRDAAAAAAAAAQREQDARTAREEAAARAAQQAAATPPAATKPAPATKPPATKPPTTKPPTTKPPTTPTPPPPTTPTPPAPSGGVAAVIAFARAQLGDPYVWAGAGPDVWDCSGLTMMAWRQAGVYLSHYAPTQWTQTARVPLSQLQPGDIVFYGTSPPAIHHVGLYIGNGQMIQAPHTGDVVKISSIYIEGDILPYGGRPG